MSAAVEQQTHFNDAVSSSSGTADSGHGVNEKAGNNPMAISKEEFLSPTFYPKHMNLIVQEGIILAGGAAAILLQVAEAGVGAGVNEHSNFAYRVTDRLRTTMTFVYVLGYGTPQERKTITDLVYKVHTQVNGTLNEGRDKGKKYDAQDPGLQLWVAATLYHCALDVYQKIYGPIDDEPLMDKIYAEYSVIATSLQVPASMWPPSRQAFKEYWDAKIAAIEITAHAKAVAKDLLYLTHAPPYLRMLMPSVRLTTAEFLPERIRVGFGINRHETMYKLHLLGIKAVYRPLPLYLKSMPVRMYMKDMRKRLAGREKVFEKA